MIKKVNADYQNDGPFSSSFTGLNLQSEGAREREREKGKEFEDFSKLHWPTRNSPSLSSN
jgi:hypothetical protein